MWRSVDLIFMFNLKPAVVQCFLKAPAICMRQADGVRACAMVWAWPTATGVAYVCGMAVVCCHRCYQWPWSWRCSWGCIRRIVYAMQLSKDPGRAHQVLYLAGGWVVWVGWVLQPGTPGGVRKCKLCYVSSNRKIHFNCRRNAILHSHRLRRRAGKSGGVALHTLHKKWGWGRRLGWTACDWGANKLLMGVAGAGPTRFICLRPKPRPLSIWQFGICLALAWLLIA